MNAMHNLGLNVFCNEEPLWMALCLRDFKGAIQRDGTWKLTWVLTKGLVWRGNPYLRLQNYNQNPQDQVFYNISRPAFRSTFLSNRYYCCHVNLNGFYPTEERIERVHISDRERLNPAAFTLEFDLPRKPVVIQGAIDSWPAMKKWSIEDLALRCGENIKWSVSHAIDEVPQFDVSLTQYSTYMHKQTDETPLYIFDSGFGEKVPEMLQEYSLDTFGGLFKEDWLSVLGKEGRPKFRWFVAGPARTGAPWHKDPSYTSAWNALVRGRKRWALYPPGKTPPGVGVAYENDEDECPEDVATPSSLRWFLDVYPSLSLEERPLEIIQEAGDTIFVPAGWWHLVLNLEDTVSVTQNFVNQANVRAATMELWSDRGGEFVENWALKMQQQMPSLTPLIDKVLLPLREGYPNGSAYSSSFHDLEGWVDKLSAVLRHHKLISGLKSDPPLNVSAFQVLGRRLNPTFEHLESGLVIKFFSHFGQGDLDAGSAAIESPWEHDGHGAYRSEVGSLLLYDSVHHSGNLPDNLPHLVAHGEYYSEGYGLSWRWPYVIETRVPGRTLGKVREALLQKVLDQSSAAASGGGWSVPSVPTTLESQSLEEHPKDHSVSMLSLASWLGARLRVLHDLSQITGPGPTVLYQHMESFTRLLQIQRKYAVSSHLRKALLPAPLLESMANYIDTNWAGLCCVPSHDYVGLHGDLQEENVMVQCDALSEVAKTESYLLQVWGGLLAGEENYLHALVHRLVHVDKLRLSALIFVDDHDLVELGVPFGLRKALLRGIAQLRRERELGPGASQGVGACSSIFADHYKDSSGYLAGQNSSSGVKSGKAAIDFRPVGIIDYGDARAGDALYDFVAVQISTFRCESASWTRFMQAYRCDHPHIQARLAQGSRLSDIMMCFTILHPCGALELAKEYRPQLFSGTLSWPLIAEQLFPFA